MDSLVPKGYTRMLAENQDEYNNLAIIDKPVNISMIPGKIREVNCMYSYWKPDAEELNALNKGAVICLGILGTQYPPVILGVTDEPS